MTELKQAARSLRDLADYLEAHPGSLLSQQVREWGTVSRLIGACWLACSLAGCAAVPEPHYYRPSPTAARGAVTVFPERSDTAVTVELPALLDRIEIEGSGAHTVAIREFDRWAAPLDEMVPQVLDTDLALAEGSRGFPDDRSPHEQHLVDRVDEFMAGAMGSYILTGFGRWSPIQGRDQADERGDSRCKFLQIFGKCRLLPRR